VRCHIRALQTLELSFPIETRTGHEEGVPIVALECARERCGTHPCDSRRCVDDLQVGSVVQCGAVWCSVVQCGAVW